MIRGIISTHASHRADVRHDLPEVYASHVERVLLLVVSRLCSKAKKEGGGAKKREERKISESHKHRERKKKGGKKHRNLHHHRVSRSPSPRSRREEKKKNKKKKLDSREKNSVHHTYTPPLLHGFQKFGKNKNNTNNASHPKNVPSIGTGSPGTLVVSRSCASWAFLFSARRTREVLRK